MDERSRRSILGTGAGTLAALTGCLGGDETDGDGSGAAESGESAAESGETGGESTNDDGTPGTESPDGETGEYSSLVLDENTDVDFDHAAADGINEQPTLGDREWPGVIVAFEDPSCPTCARFNEETLPRIESELVETEDVAYVFRGYPVIYEWGKPATQALEATYDREPVATWKLKDHYFEFQEEFSTDNVLEKTSSFLDSDTAVDGAAVVEDVEADAYADAVQVDFDAGQEAGASATPTFYLFRGGEFQTTISGPQDYSIFENVLLG